MNTLENYHAQLFDYTRTVIFPHAFESSSNFSDFEVFVRLANDGRPNTKLAINQRLPNVEQFVKRYMHIVPSNSQQNLDIFLEIHETPSAFALLSKQIKGVALIQALSSLLHAVVLDDEMQKRALNKNIGIKEHELIREMQDHTLKRMTVSGGNFDSKSLKVSTQMLMVFCVSLLDSLLKFVFSANGQPSPHDFQSSDKIKKKFKNVYEFDFFADLERKLLQDKCDINFLNGSLKGTFTQIFDDRHNIVHRDTNVSPPLGFADLVLLFYYAGISAVTPLGEGGMTR